MEAFHSESVQQIASSICSDENLTESSNGYLLKGNLTKAVNLHYNGASVDFASGSELFDKELPVKYLKLKEQEKSFKIPVTLNNISTLTQTPQCRSLKNSWVIDASQVYCSTAEDLDISSLVIDNLQLPKEMKITAKLSSLILYKGGNGFVHSLVSCFVDEKFGTAILQVPVEGGHEGGNLNVVYEGRKKTFESHERSDAMFYLTAFYDSCEHFIEPISRGCKLVLVYDLLWSNAANQVPRNFPFFLATLKQIKQSLHPWLYRYKLWVKSRQNLEEEIKEPTSIASKLQQDSTERSKCFKNEANVLFVDKTIQENVFFFVLQESYEEKTLSFLLLQGHDRVFADVLFNCDFLDVHLANATQSSFEVQQGKVDVFEISRVIDSDDMTRNLSMKLHWDKNFVGLIPSYPKKKLEEDNSEDSIEAGKKNLHRGVLLIWPKYHSVLMYCRYGLHSLLVRIGTSLKSTCMKKVRTKVLPDLRQLISYCCAEPREVWNKSGMKKGELTQRLFDFCISLRAREEGLHLLKNLALNFDEDSLDTEDFEGIQTEDVALAIAKFEHRVCGWNVIAESIRALVKPNRIPKQLVPITKLAKHFLCFHCFDGAKMVGDCISSLFAEMDSSLAWQSKCCDVEAVVDMLVALESHPETSSRKRVKSFALFFFKLRPSLQCHLLLDFESQHGFHLRTIPSWQFVYQDLCAAFSESSNSSPPPLMCMTVEFMNGIQVWLSKLREEAKLRPELVEPNGDTTDSVLEHTSAISSSPQSFGGISSSLDPDFQLRDFELAYAEISISEVAADQPPAYGRATNPLGIWVRNPQAAPAVDISISTSDETAVQEDEDFDESISAISTSPNSFGGISSSLDPDFQLRDFELAYAEMSSSEVAADQPPAYGRATNPLGIWVRNPQAAPAVDIVSSLEACSTSEEFLQILYDSDENNRSFIDTHSSDSSLGFPACPLFTSTPTEEIATTKCFNESGPKVSDSVVWKGALVSKFSGKANLRALEMIGSQSIPLMEMPSTLELQVRISFKTFLDHVNLTRSQNRDVFFVPFLPIEKEQEMYFSFMKNLKLVGRVFVIKPFSEHIKNYYLVILQKDDAALKDLIPFSQKNDYLKDQTHDMLLGVALSAKKRSY